MVIRKVVSMDFLELGCLRIRVCLLVGFFRGEFCLWKLNWKLLCFGVGNSVIGMFQGSFLLVFLSGVWWNVVRFVKLWLVIVVLWFCVLVFFGCCVM